MPENILVVVGSPRSGGNTDMLADAFIHGARDAGNRVTKFPVGSMNIRGCMDCKYCFSHDGACTQKDDMQLVYPALEQADMLVFASPVYFFGLSAQTKAFMDRLHVFSKKGFPMKSTALLSVCADEAEEVLRPGVDTYRQVARHCGLQDRGIITVAGVHAMGDILKSGALEKARDLGLSIT